MKSAWVAIAVVLLAGCAGPLAPEVRPVSYRIDVDIDPVSHTLRGDVTLEIAPLDLARPAGEPIRVELQLHPELTIDALDVRGATLLSHKRHKGKPDDDDDEYRVVPRLHRLGLGEAGDSVHLRLQYHGPLHQDVSAGEKEGEVHNFAVSAHIGEEGLYLVPGGYWYPSIAFPEDDDPSLNLADYRLSVNALEGFEFVAGLERDGETVDGRQHWSSPFPLEGAVLLGGPFRRWSRTHGEIELHAVLAPDKEAVAQDILDASAEYLDRYQPLIGPYPFREFTLLEAFFSSGFAFPTCTQIVGSQLSEYKQYRRHGYLDHELLHNWWGNGVFVDPRDGNWCEGLASYLGNYYGFVLEGDEKGARKQRRNQSNFLSAIEAEDDKPLGTFSLDDGAGRGIGYSKGAAVFHMLSRKIGEDAFFAGLRRVNREATGQFTDWRNFRNAFEEESGVDLSEFFDQWVRRGGAPMLELTAASWVPGAREVEVSISQGPTEFTLDVPLRLHYEGRSEDVVVTIDPATDTVRAPCAQDGLTAVELDPDFHVFRRLKPEEIMPTTLLTRRAERLLIVSPDGEIAEGYQAVIETFTHDVLGDEDESKEDHEVIVKPGAEFKESDASGGSVLILGDAVHQETVRAFLDRTRSPIVWKPSGFEIERQVYDEPGHAVLATVHHPDSAEDGVTVYAGNSPASLANARVLTYYANSLLVYDTPVADASDGALAEGMPHTKVIRRADFEFHDRIEF